MTVTHQHSEVTIYLDDTERFDYALHGDDMRVLQDMGDLRVITKHGATISGRTGVCLTFTVDLDGKPARAQTVVSAKIFTLFAKLLSAKYDEEGMPR
jgi:hypothetical protein